MWKILAALILFASVSGAQIYDKGNMGLGIIIGGGSLEVDNKTQNYTIAGASVDYFVIDNMSVGIGYMSWFGASPSLNQITVPVHYYLPLDEKYRPYFGAFIRETLLESPYESYESYGLKMGIAIKLSQKVFLGIGVVQEYYGSCDFQKECSSAYPELVATFAF
ncbi:hypothetical protein KJ877_00815 [bacterium]|nr:hypothetical protein [bacterium]MBU1989569.1 hypothetical protein [bacterium]